MWNGEKFGGEKWKENRIGWKTLKSKIYLQRWFKVFFFFMASKLKFVLENVI